MALCGGSRWSLGALCGSRGSRIVLDSFREAKVYVRASSTASSSSRLDETRTIPSSFSLFSGETRSTIRAYSWSQIEHDADKTLQRTFSILRQAQFGKRSDSEGTDTKAATTNSTSPFTWLSAVGATNDEIRSICRAFDVHPLTIEDMLNRETRDKVEIFDRYRFITYSSFDERPQSPTYLQVRNAYILLFPTALVSFHFQHPTHVDLVEKRLGTRDGHHETIEARADWVAYALIDVITDAFRPATSAIEHDVETIENALLAPLESDAKATSRLLHQVGACRGKTLRLRRLLGEKREVLTTLRRRAQRDPALPAQEIDLYLSDVQDHLASMAQDLVHFEDSLSRAQSNCLVNIQIQSAEFSNRTNNALSKLTVLGTVLVPLNVITGVWGMNVRVPGQEVDSLFWFTAITSAMACVAFCSFLWARRYLRGETTSSTNSKGH